MRELSRKKSTALSFIVAIVFLIGVAVCAVFLPQITRIFLRLKAGQTLGEAYWFSLIVAYLVLVLATVCDILLLRILGNIKKGEVFVEGNVAILRALSWCVMLASVPFILLGLVFKVAFAVGGVALFVGICLRVVKNAFAEAVAIKDENDYTI